MTTEATLALAVGCVLQVAETRVSPEDGGWIERTHLEIVASPSCAWVDVGLPADALLGEHRAKQKLGDGTGTRLGPERWALSPRAVDGSGVARLYTPELLGGDRVYVDFERHLPPGPIAWRPGPARFVQIELSGDGVLDAPGATGGSAWASDTADFVARIDPRGGSAPLAPPATDPRGGSAPLAPPSSPPPLPAGDVRVERRLTLVVPPGDPLVALYPGGGSSVAVVDRLEFAAADEARAWPLPAPPGAAIALDSAPAGVASLVQDRGGARVIVGPSEGPTRVTVGWQQPDAPIFGEPDGVDALFVDADGGEVLHDGDAWYLARMRGRTLAPPRDVLIRAVDARFREAALPEPGAPIELRGRRPDWATAAELRPALLGRVAIAEWPADPLFPRNLRRARKALALTPTEAALTLWLYALQLHYDAQWALVRPAWRGPGPELVPVGYTRALVWLRVGDETRWIDPTCSVCGPFELPPELEGAAVFGPGDVRVTPPPTPGRHEVTVRDDEVVWKLEGSAALALRLALRDIPADARAAAIGAAIGGPGAALRWTQGLDQAGSDVLAVAARADGLAVDPLNLPAPDGAGTVWVEWVGERVIRWPDAPSTEVHLDDGPLHYARVREDGHLIERLVVDRRELPADAVARVAAARAEPVPPPVDAPPADAPPEAVSPPEPAPAPP